MSSLAFDLYKICLTLPHIIVDKMQLQSPQGAASRYRIEKLPQARYAKTENCGSNSILYTIAFFKILNSLN
jgi:hypothetical protein